MPEKATWIANCFSYIKTTPVKMSLWFNSDYPQRDYSVFSDDQNGLDPYGAGGCKYVDTNITYNAYREYKSGVDDPYFIGADPANSRLLTDTQFQGGF